MRGCVTAAIGSESSLLCVLLNINDNIHEMQQSRSMAFLMQQKKEGWGINNDTTNAKYETIDAQTRKNCNRGTAFEWPEKKLLDAKSPFIITRYRKMNQAAIWMRW